MESKTETELLTQFSRNVNELHFSKEYIFTNVSDIQRLQTILFFSSYW